MIVELFNKKLFLYQWDIDQKVIINDDTATCVHFSNAMRDVAYVVGIYMLDGKRVANIPNILLQDTCDLDCFVCDDQKTIANTIFQVRDRVQPSSYEYTETEIINMVNLQNSKLDKSGHTPNKYLGTDALGNIVFKDPPATGDFYFDVSEDGDSIIINTSLPVNQEGDTIIIGEV